MNILKITKCKSEKSFNDIIKVASFDNKNNIVKEEIFENIVEFDIDDNVDEINRIRKDFRDYEETNTLCLKLIYKLLKYVL